MPSGRIRGLPVVVGIVAALATLIVLMTFESYRGAGAATAPGMANLDGTPPAHAASAAPSSAGGPPAVPGGAQFYVGTDTDPTTLAQFEQEAGVAQPAILGGYSPASGQVVGVISEARNLPGTVPMVSWNVQFTSGLAFGTADGYLKQQAQAVAGYGKPVFIRLDWEMNGTWEKGWSLPKVTTSQYIADWQHVVDVFRSAGATNAAFVWCPNAGTWNNLPPMAWYPGDGYVDWIGVDAYPRQGSGINVLTEPGGLDQIAAFARGHGKPAMLAEWGVTSPDPDNAWLFDLVFQWQSQYADTVKALVYFNYFGTSGDHSLSTHPNGAAELRYLIASHPDALTKATVAPRP